MSGMEYANWLTSLAHTSRVMHAVLSGARNRVHKCETGADYEARLVAALDGAISSLSSVMVSADIAADMRARPALGHLPASLNTVADALDAQTKQD